MTCDFPLKAVYWLQQLRGREFSSLTELSLASKSRVYELKIKDTGERCELRSLKVSTTITGSLSRQPNFLLQII